MAEADCHVSDLTPRNRAKHLILKGLGAKRVAAWCGVEEATVYQWLSRGSDAEPIPPSRVAAIVNGARSEGLTVAVGVLWPALGGAESGAATEGAQS